MYKLVSIDPGAKHVALACWNKQEYLQKIAVYVFGSFSTKDRISIDVPRIAEKAFSVWLERMLYYPLKVESVPNDLLDVAYVGSAAAYTISNSVNLVTANEWKGQTPKATCHLRIMNILTSKEIYILTDCLQYIKKQYHKDVLDAVGIGLYVLGRTK